MGKARGIRRALIGAGICGAVAALAAPGAGAAAPVQVQEGDFGDRPVSTAFNAFYPKRVAVQRGGSVRFTVVGFHNVIFPKRASALPGLIAPTGALIPPRTDPAGAPYWWSGQAALGFNPAVAAPSGGTAVTGAKTVNSGFVGGNPPTFTVTFPKVGTFVVRCAVHPRMRGTITVLPTGAKGVSKPAALRRAARRQKAADARTALRLARTATRAARRGTVVQIGPGSRGVDLLAFFPKLRTVPAGTDVTFQMKSADEIHTVTFGPDAYVDQVEQGFGRDLDPEGVFSSDAPGTTPALSPTTHGNGYLNSGLLTSPGTPGLPKAFTVRFSTPGTYEYRCIVHPEMKGRIAVT